ncbi:MAG: polysaccharide biosynthesis protein [Campylobacterales bacterium]|nr:polysaccharide biosynthesis protein [Campylobacterales bacterium]
MYHGKTLLITGGTGSFGKEMVENFLQTDISQIRIFSRDEKKQEELRFHFANERLKFYIGDVRDYRSVLAAMSGVNYVFHAAALKQVPSCEFYPIEAVKTNVLGAENVMQACLDKNVERCVVLSTDKAVYPINAMGMSKALMEKAMVAKSHQSSSTIFCATRYGNVMASRGSVIPLFIKQLKNNEEITITDPNMTRFLMSLKDSVDLVKYAFDHGQGGDIFVQKQPACTIKDLGVALSSILEVPYNCRIIGARHGEKLFESLLSREEMAVAEDLGGYFKIPKDQRGLNYASYEVQGDKKINVLEDYTSHNTTRLVGEELAEFIREKLGEEYFQ